MHVAKDVKAAECVLIPQAFLSGMTMFSSHPLIMEECLCLQPRPSGSSSKSPFAVFLAHRAHDKGLSRFPLFIKGRLLSVDQRDEDLKNELKMAQPLLLMRVSRCSDFIHVGH